MDGQELALVVENIALREQIGGLMVGEIKNCFVNSTDSYLGPKHVFHLNTIYIFCFSHSM